MPSTNTDTIHFPDRELGHQRLGLGKVWNLVGSVPSGDVGPHSRFSKYSSPPAMASFGASALACGGGLCGLRALSFRGLASWLLNIAIIQLKLY